MKTITVLTATYNRSKFLYRLYDSLRKQTNTDFEWFVVDDGSSDDTEKLLTKLQSKHELDMRFLIKVNGGKHRALNCALPELHTQLTFIVDSDDELPEQAIETIIKYHNKYRDTEGLCGYSFLRCNSGGEVNTALFPENEKIDSFCNVRINGNIGGDKAEVFYTDILKRYPFPEFDGEKFMPEDAVWMQMSEQYNMVHINEYIYTCDYLADGLTKTGRRMKIHSPKGMAFRSKIYVNDKSVCGKVKLKMMILYIIYNQFAGICCAKQLDELTCKIRWLWFMCYFPSVCIYCVWKKKYNKNN